MSDPESQGGPHGAGEPGPWQQPGAGAPYPGYPRPPYPGGQAGGYPQTGGYPPPPPPYPGGYPAHQPWGGGYPPPQQPGGGYPQPPWQPDPWAGPSAQPAPLPSFPHPEPRPYHLMLRTWNYVWWKPVVGIVVVVLGMLVIAPLLLLPVLAVAVAVEGGPFGTKFMDALTLQTVDPAALLYLNLVLGSMILVTWFVMRVIHRMRPRWLTSVKPRMRWRFFFACLGLAVVALLAQIAVSSLLPGAQEGDLSGKLNQVTGTTVALALIVVLTTPLQAAGEEYLFRGYLMQAVGSLFRLRWLAILVTATLFAFAHGVQNFPLFFDRFTFGLIAGWLVTRTGGLEAGIAMHILNNFLAFGFALSFGDLTSTLNVSEVSWWNIVLTVTQSGVYAVLVLWLARRMGLQRETRPPLEPPYRGSPADAAPVPSGA